MTLYDEPQPVAAPPHILYSTGPRLSAASDGHDYFIKGPDTPTIVAEAVAYELAGVVGLDVPAWAWCRDPVSGAVHFASRSVRVRSGIDQLLDSGNLVNPDFLASCVAFDVWISNRDRNIGNIVADPVGGARTADVRLYAIDFEKADVLRGVSRFEITARFSPAMCRPTGDLERHFAALPLPTNACRAIGAVTRGAIQTIFDNVVLSLAGHEIPWASAAADYLGWRGERIEALVGEAWHA